MINSQNKSHITQEPFYTLLVPNGRSRTLGSLPDHYARLSGLWNGEGSDMKVTGHWCRKRVITASQLMLASNQ